MLGLGQQRGHRDGDFDFGPGGQVPGEDQMSDICANSSVACMLLMINHHHVIRCLSVRGPGIPAPRMRGSMVCLSRTD